MRRVLIVLPTAWDQKQLESCRADWETDFEVVYGEPRDADCRWDFDVLGYIARSIEEWRGRLDGVFSSSDYPGAPVAAAIAEGLGLPGPGPAEVLRASHKGLSRGVQRTAAPEAVPDYALLDPDRLDCAMPPFGFPCFVKPVKGTFSVHARRIESAAGLRAMLASPVITEYRRDFLAVHHALIRQHLGAEVRGDLFLAEELLTGTLHTVECCASGDEVELLGVTDSIRHPSGSFARFDYPSSLPARVQQRSADIAARIARALGLRDTLFNVETMYDAERDRVAIVEINPRMCGQFGDLYAKVDGRHGHVAALHAAVGAPLPRARRRGAWACAASVPLRVFEPVRVSGAPDAERIAAVEREHAGTLVWTDSAAGDVLADFATGEDGSSARYAVVNVGGRSRADLLARRDAAVAALGYAFEPV